VLLRPLRWRDELRLPGPSEAEEESSDEKDDCSSAVVVAAVAAREGIDAPSSPFARASLSASSSSCSALAEAPPSFAVVTDSIAVRRLFVLAPSHKPAVGLKSLSLMMVMAAAGVAFVNKNQSMLKNWEWGGGLAVFRLGRRSDANVAVVILRARCLGPRSVENRRKKKRVAVSVTVRPPGQRS
jgi:hypothetical protein